jgi:hypothetical protein
MRLAVSGLLAAVGAVASANASPALLEVSDHNPNIILAASGCGLGFYRTAEGCVSYRYGFLVPGTANYPYSWWYPHYWGAYYYPYYGSSNPQSPTTMPSASGPNPNFNGANANAGSPK